MRVRLACSSSLRGSTCSSLRCRSSSEMERSCEHREELRGASVAAAEQCCSAHTRPGTAHHSWMLAQAGDGPQSRASHSCPGTSSWVQAALVSGCLEASPRQPPAAHVSVCTAESARSSYEPRAIRAKPINTELLVPPACWNC